MKKLIIIALLFIASGSAQADFTTGNDLQEWLNKSKSEVDSYYYQGLSLGYVGGVVDFGDGILFCTGLNVTRGQYLAVVEKFVNNNPEKWNNGASSLVIEAMIKAFPCKK